MGKPRGWLWTQLFFRLGHSSHCCGLSVPRLSKECDDEAARALHAHRSELESPAAPRRGWCCCYHCHRCTDEDCCCCSEGSPSDFAKKTTRAADVRGASVG